jgi:putative ubiquitin-RnfH superfamily antitoxin RatB of RatAB toxin-antitoxin module
MSGALRSGPVSVEIVHADTERCIALTCCFPGPATVAEALACAAADPRFAGIDVLRAPVGIFGRLVCAAQPLADGDRVELYRALRADPKIARRDRAGAQQRRGGGRAGPHHAARNQ